MFPSTSVDMFPITLGVENAVLIAIKATRNTWRLLYCWKENKSKEPWKVAVRAVSRVY